MGNYFDHTKCLAWPRDYHPVPRDGGYHIADAESRAWSGEGCDRPMAMPEWKSGYSAEYPHAIYEPGQVYCLAWPMKNHAYIDLAGCDNNHAKADSGHDVTLSLYVSNVNVTNDPLQSEFFVRNINELAGLASNCQHVWHEPGDVGHELLDECQLGLEKHQNGQADCKGFQRAPKFCENTGEAMGTGCFKVPDNFAPGHYVAQWRWSATFEGRGSFPYSTCFDFEVVPVGSGRAHPGLTGTTGTADTSHFDCQNNMLKFSGSHPTIAPGATTTASSTDMVVTTAAVASTKTSTLAATTSETSCVGPWDHCADPNWARPKCCMEGYECKYSSLHWARCQLASSTSIMIGVHTILSTTTTTLPATTTTTTTRTTTKMVISCAAPWEHCAEPGWLAPKCCTSGYTCVFANGHWARCQPLGGRSRSFLAAHHSLFQNSISQKTVEMRSSRPDPHSEL